MPNRECNSIPPPSSRIPTHRSKRVDRALIIAPVVLQLTQHLPGRRVSLVDLGRRITEARAFQELTHFGISLADAQVSLGVCPAPAPGCGGICPTAIFLVIGRAVLRGQLEVGAAVRFGFIATALSSASMASLAAAVYI